MYIMNLIFFEIILGNDFIFKSERTFIKSLRLFSKFYVKEVKMLLTIIGTIIFEYIISCIPVN